MKIIKVIFVLSIIISLVVYILNTDLHLVKTSLKHVRWNFCWLIIVTVIAYFLGTLGWRYCLGPNKSSINLMKLFWIRLIGETVSLFNPGSIIGGDMLKVALLKSYNIDRNTVINSVVISRFLMITSQISMFLLASFMLFGQMGNTFKNIVWVMLMVFLVSIILLSTAFFIPQVNGIKYPEKYFKQNNLLLNKWKQSLKNTLRQTSHLYHTEKKALLLSFLFFCLHWLVGSTEFFLILNFLNSDTTIIQGLLLDMGVIFFKSAGAFVPGQIGIEEYGNKFMLDLLGVSGISIWISASILRRARQFFWLALSGFGYLILYRKTLQVQVV